MRLALSRLCWSYFLSIVTRRNCLYHFDKKFTWRSYFTRHHHVHVNTYSHRTFSQFPLTFSRDDQSHLTFQKLTYNTRLCLEMTNRTSLSKKLTCNTYLCQDCISEVDILFLIFHYIWMINNAVLNIYLIFSISSNIPLVISDFFLYFRF